MSRQLQRKEGSGFMLQASAECFKEKRERKDLNKKAVSKACGPVAYPWETFIKSFIKNKGLSAP